MVYKHIFSLLCLVFVVTQVLCPVGVQHVEGFEIFQNQINIGDVDHNQCDILLKKKLILIGPYLFSVNNTGKALYNFFPEAHDLSFFKKVKISPDGKYIGFLSNGSKPCFYLFKAEDNSFTRFTKIFITMDCRADLVVESFCFIDNQELVLIMSLRNITTCQDNLIGLSSSNNVSKKLDNIMSSHQEKQHYFFCRNLKNNNYSWTSIVVMDDIVDIDFLRRGLQGARFVAKSACGVMLWFDSDGEWLDFRESRAYGFEDSKMKFALDNKFGFLYNSQGFKVWEYAQNKSEIIKFKYKLCDNLKLITGAYEFDGKDSRASRLALICYRDSKIFYYEYIVKD